MTLRKTEPERKEQNLAKSKENSRFTLSTHRIGEKWPSLVVTEAHAQITDGLRKIKTRVLTVHQKEMNV